MDYFDEKSTFAVFFTIEKIGRSNFQDILLAFKRNYSIEVKLNYIITLRFLITSENFQVCFRN